MDTANTPLSRGVTVTAASTLAAAGLALVNGALTRRAEHQLPKLGDYIEVDGVRLRYLSRGEGPPVVLVHGNGTMIEDWTASGVFDALAGSHRVIAFDRPGFGCSDRPRGKDWSPQEQADLLARALDELGIASAVVVGHSIGTQIVLALALNHPRLVSRMVLVSGYYFPTTRMDTKLFAPPAIPVLGDLMRHTVSPWLSRAMTPLVNRELFAPGEVPRAWTEGYPFELAYRPSQIFALSSDSTHLVTTAQALCGRYQELVSLPVTIITGDGDRVVDLEPQSRRLHAELPHSELIVLPGVGHMAHYSAVAQIAAAVG